MKKSVVVFAALILVVCCGKGSEAAAPILGQLGYQAGMSGRAHKHDFSVNANNDGPRALTETGICVFCHTPHGASAESTLWNRRDPIGPDGGFPLYGGADPTGPFGTSNLRDGDIQPLAEYGTDSAPGVIYPNGASRLCLSCHDGVSAIGGVLNGGDIIMEGGIDTIQTASAIIDLSVSHPISFVYSLAVVNGFNNGRKWWDPLDTYKLPDPAISPLDGQGRMQCTTCHDPHFDTRLASGQPTYLPFWRRGSGKPDDPGNDYDPVCKNCHEGDDWSTGPGH